MDGRPGIFPRQANGPMRKDEDGNFQITPMAVGKKLIVAPGNQEKEITITTNTSDLQLIDGRGLYNNGWFVVRTTIPLGAVKNAVEWMISPKIESRMEIQTGRFRCRKSATIRNRQNLPSSNWINSPPLTNRSALSK